MTLGGLPLESLTFFFPAMAKERSYAPEKVFERCQQDRVNGRRSAATLILLVLHYGFLVECICVREPNIPSSASLIHKR